MLTEQDRINIASKLINDDIDHCLKNEGHIEFMCEHILRFGFVGYANMTDEQLVDKFNIRFKTKAIA